MRGGTDAAGFHTSSCDPGRKERSVRQTVSPAGRPARIVSVRTASIRTRAGRVSRNETRAAPRRGESVENSLRSPANGRAERTRRPSSSGPRPTAARAAAGAASAPSASTRRNPRRPTLIGSSCH